MADPVRCPRDGTEALEVPTLGRRRRFRTDVCPACNGVWLDRGEVAKASGDKEVERLIVDYAAGPTGLACPRCGTEMAARPVGDLRLDVCPACRGVWADAGELETAARLLGAEFSDVASASGIGGQLGEFPGATRATQLTRVMYLGFARPSLRYLLTPKITRRYPRDRL